MLVFLFTDACISQGALKGALRAAIDNSFNCITVDGCMSTNDSVMLLANGLAANPLIRSGKNYKLFQKGLETLCVELAKSLVRDGEGATKFIQIDVLGARNDAQARIGALAIANSDLFKTAIYGQNPNFGRIVASIGASGIAVDEEKIKIKVSALTKKDIEVKVALKQGKGHARVYTCDLTPEYIKINAEYN